MYEIFNLHTLCRCCHKDGSFKSLQLAYNHQDHIEVYSIMLQETFDISITPPPLEASYAICDDCIQQLRDALTFKKQVLECERKFQMYCKNEEALKVKEEVTDNSDDEIKYSDGEYNNDYDETYDCKQEDICKVESQDHKTDDEKEFGTVKRENENEKELARKPEKICTRTECKYINEIIESITEITEKYHKDDLLSSESVRPHVDQLFTFINSLVSSENTYTSDSVAPVDSPSNTSNVKDPPRVKSEAAYSNFITESDPEPFKPFHGFSCPDESNLNNTIYITKASNGRFMSQANSHLVSNCSSHFDSDASITSCEPILITTTELDDDKSKLIENLQLSNVISEDTSIDTAPTIQQNYEILAAVPTDELYINVASNKKCYSLSSDDENDLLMEKERLDDAYQVSPNQPMDTEYTENRSQQVMASEKYLRDEPETNEEDEGEPRTNEDKSDTENGLTQNVKVTEDRLKPKHIREKDFCFYCETFILNFSRHMQRNHIAEPEVQLALSHPKSSLERKKTFANLRKKGNYISYTRNEFKPVRKCRFSKNKSDYLPCTKCLGFYAKKQLWKHIKVCDKTESTKNIQVKAQNFLVRKFKIDKDLQLKVFPRMLPDKVSLIAKTDKLICMYGAEYLRSRREGDLALVASRKMRELAKLLMEVSKINLEITSLLQVLKPQYYDTLVKATKIVARFNDVTGRFDAPSYALNLATSLKRCCSISLLQCGKMEENANTATIEADLTTLSKLITDKWKSDISDQAAVDLHTKKLKNTTMVTLATDLKLLQDYLCKIANQSTEILKNNNNMNVNAFNNLVEVVYCRVLLLNGRRFGMLQRLKLSDYNKVETNDTNYEEFNVLSAIEKELAAALKIVVIRGKSGRRIPVLFSSEVEADIKILLSVRKKYIPKDNDILLARAGRKVVGWYRVLKKYAKGCRAKNFWALISPRLRKHLATITQLLLMTESDQEQLATFMEHTLGVHKNNDRFPNDVYQIAKISKLLLSIEDGKADIYKGKALDEIELNLDEEITGDEIANQEVVDFELELIPQNEKRGIPEKIQSTSNKTDHALQSNSQNKSKKKRVLVPWTTEQRDVVTKYFNNHINHKKAPKRSECDALKDMYPTLLHNKDWLKIKVFIQNLYSKK